MTATLVRTTRAFTQRINAAPHQVFPLLCPVREAEWLEGWTYDLLHSQSGYAEEGCVFRTQPAGDPETVWVVTRHDPADGIVEFVRVTAGLIATQLQIHVEAAGEAVSSVCITYHFVPTSEAGARLVRERHAEAEFRKAMEWWERSMNHYLETGTRLGRERGKS